jgi:hypothetical protein
MGCRVCLCATGEEQLRELGRADLRELPRVVQELLLLVMAADSCKTEGGMSPSALTITRTHIMASVEALEMALAAAALKGGATLELRLAGLSLLTDKVRRQGQGSGGDEAQVLACLLRSEVVEELFGPRIHVEALLRAEELVHFMAAREALSTAQLEVMWSSIREGKHEAVARVVSELLVGLVPRLRPDLRLYLLSRISAIPISRYKPQTLQIIHDLSLSALKAQAQEQQQAQDSNNSSKGALSLEPRGSMGADEDGPGGGSSARRGQVVHCADSDWLGVFWRFLQDDKDRPEDGTPSLELTDKAAELLVSLMDEMRGLGAERDATLLRCVHNVRAHR